jgi:hypothetical protein
MASVLTETIEINEEYSPTEADWADYRAFLAEQEAEELDRLHAMETIRAAKLAGGRSALRRLRSVLAVLEAGGYYGCTETIRAACNDVEAALALVND